MLRVDKLTYYYPDTDNPALEEVTFELPRGEILLLLGANRSGKSTLCYALAGFAPHFFQGEIEGDVILEKRSMRRASLENWVQEVGLVLQNPFNQISGARMTIFEEVAFGLENLGVPRDEMETRVHAVLRQLEIDHLADRSPYQVSGGQMQRVAIASILVLQPRLLVLDEPTAQLDPEGRAEIFAILRHLVEQGTTVVIATQELEDAAELASRALVLREGKVALQGRAEAVLGDLRLPGWQVEPPVYVPLGASLSLAPPLPVTFEAARERFAGTSLMLAAQAPKLWPFSAPRTFGPSLTIPPVEPAGVSVEQLTFSYPNGVEALRGVTVEARPGQVTALIGANGAGKSTLSRMLNGLLRPAGGTVRVGDLQVADHPTSELARWVAYLFQNPAEQLFASTVEQEILFGPRNLRFDEDGIVEAVEFALVATGLTGMRDTHPYDLHPAQRRWVALASILALRAPVLILDEPTTGLDLADKEHLVVLLRRLKQAGYTILLVSHDMQLVTEEADRIYVMAAGEVLAHGTAAEIFVDEGNLDRADVRVAPVPRLARALGMAQEIVTVRAFLEAAAAGQVKRE